MDKKFGGGAASEVSRNGMIRLNHHRFQSQHSGDFRSVDESEKIVRKLVGAGEKEQFIFTSCGAEGVAHVMQSALFDHIYPTGKNHIITTNVEGADILLTHQRFEQMNICSHVVPVNSLGQLTPDILDLYASPRTALLSISWAHPLTGVVQPIWELAEYCKEHGILLHVNATEVLGRQYFELRDMPIDFLTFDGPIGSGGLFVKERLSPLIPTGDPQVLRGGTLNHEALSKLANWAQELMESRDHVCMETARLRRRFEMQFGEGLLCSSERLPTTCAVAFPGVSAEALLYYLENAGLSATIGGGDQQKLEYVLGNCGVDLIAARSAVSFCLSSKTTSDEIDRAVSIIQKELMKLEKIAGSLLEEADV
ncbi:MAG: aminotransferase class V-fold PLP-dependent enzyme [Simkaniaceae bacterium]|nr:aminotransferase class V-fold PLP-dependent enzyme [Simkaniaceae bacterium]